MTVRSFLLVSPREPSGATWLINCLLELGICVYRASHAPMWRQAADGWTLAPHEEILKKWLPSLSLRDRFRFRDDIEVRWTHEWPAAESCRRAVILFVRDPRDALLSRFKREAGELDFAGFVAFPDPRSLLDKADHWLLFLRCWLACAPVRVLRFEDYKRDARATLSEALAFIGIDPGGDDFARAIEASTFEKAAGAERAYRVAHPEDRELINRQGVPGEWRGLPEYEAEMRRIEAGCAGLMRDLGYGPAPDLQGCEGGFLAHAELLSFFKRIPPELLRQADSRPGDATSRIGRTLAFALSVDRNLLSRALLPAYEQAALAASLEEYLTALSHGAAEKLRAAGLAPDRLAPVYALVRKLARRTP